MFQPETTLNRRALRRESVQLLVIALGSLAVLLFTGRVVQIVAGVVDVVVLLLTAIASVVAWRVGGRGPSLAIYAVAALAFLALAVANLS